MYVTLVSPEEATDQILAHNLSDASGHKALAKGRRITAEDVPRIRALGLRTVLVAVLEAGDVHENEAARRLARAVRAPGVTATAPTTGRVNLLAETDGVVQIDTTALLAINAIDGLAVATLPSNTLALARKRVATVKIIPFAVPAGALEQAEAIGNGAGGIVGLRPLRALAVGVVIVGSVAARERLERGVAPAITGRVVERGSTVLGTCFVPPDEAAVAAAIGDLRDAGAELLIIAGETSITDRDDVTPRGIRRAGGQIEHYGAPVEPGNLLLLAYLGAPGDRQIPVLGAPGCVRSRDTNIVDLLLPRLLAGEHITRQAIIVLGHGGLLA